MQGSARRLALPAFPPILYFSSLYRPVGRTHSIPFI